MQLFLKSITGSQQSTKKETQNTTVTVIATKR